MKASCPHCGADAKAGRSSPDHRRFFGLISAAFHHWPEGHDHTPRDAEDLRAWLLCKAGFCEKTLIDCDLVADQPSVAKLIGLACESVMRAANGKGFIRIHKGAIVVFTPVSIAWEKLDQKGFNDVRDRVTTVIETELGVSADKLLKETENAA